MSRSGGRHENGRVRRMRKQFKKEGLEENAPCWVCHQPIDYEADYTDINLLERLAGDGSRAHVACD